MSMRWSIRFNNHLKKVNDSSTSPARPPLSSMWLSSSQFHIFRLIWESVHPIKNHFKCTSSWCVCVFLGWWVKYVDFIIRMRSSLVFFLILNFWQSLKHKWNDKLLIVEGVGEFRIEWHLIVDMKSIVCMYGLKHGANNLQSCIYCLLERWRPIERTT